MIMYKLVNCFEKPIDCPKKPVNCPKKPVNCPNKPVNCPEKPGSSESCGQLVSTKLDACVAPKVYKETPKLTMGGVEILRFPLVFARVGKTSVPLARCADLHERCPPRQKSIVERLKAKVESLITEVTSGLPRPSPWRLAART